MAKCKIKFSQLSIRAEGRVPKVEFTLIDIHSNTEEIHEEICEVLQERNVTSFGNAGKYGIDTKSTFIDFPVDTHSMDKLYHTIISHDCEVYIDDEILEDVVTGELTEEDINYLENYFGVSGEDEVIDVVALSAIAQLEDSLNYVGIPYTKDLSSGARRLENKIKHVELLGV